MARKPKLLHQIRDRIHTPRDQEGSALDFKCIDPLIISYEIKKSR